MRRRNEGRPLPFRELLTAEQWTGRLWVRCVIAVALLALAALAERGLATHLGGISDYLLLTPVVGAVGVYAGAGPGLVVTALGLLFALMSAAHPDGFNALAAVRAAVFLVVGLGASWAGEQRRRAIREGEVVHADLRDQQAHLRSILETVPDAMIVIDERGMLQSFSAAAERLFGYSAAEAIGDNVA